jgi:nucleotide-binding universal stress UspA family protein
MKRIVLATDGSPSAARAIEEAIELARLAAAELHVVAVWSVPTSAFGYGLVVVPGVGDAEREQGQRVLTAAADAARQAGVEVETVLREGEPATEICAVADELHADLIVIGSHGWNPFRRALLGSVSTRVLHHAPCPVLVVRGDRELREARHARSAEGAAADAETR